MIFEAVISSAQTKNHKALVRLKSSSPIYLSNSQLSSLIDALRPHLVNIMLVSTPESLRLSSIAKSKNELKLVVEAGGWKVVLTTSLDFIMSIRTCGYDSNEDSPALLIRTPRKSVNADAPVIISESDNSDDNEDRISIPPKHSIIASSTDKKFVQKYNYTPIATSSKSLKIEVVKTPKR